MVLFINNTILFQKPTDYKKYEEESWEIRFEVSFTPNILETLDTSSI